MNALLLSQGIYCLLDNRDYSWLHHFKWSVAKVGKYRYARRKGLNPSTGRHEFIYLHRIVAGVTKDFVIHFSDSNPLNLQRDNIFITNGIKKEVSWRGSSGESRYIGVKWDAYHGLWRSEIKGLVIGYHVEEMEAVLAYNKKAQEIYGNNTRLNVLECLE
jgi:hypothetical protein